jgi:hypothetical protein
MWTVTNVYNVRTKDKGQTYWCLRWYGALPLLGARVQRAVWLYLPIPWSRGLYSPKPREGGWVGGFENPSFLPIVAVFQESFHIKWALQHSAGKMMYWVKRGKEKLARVSTLIHLFSWSYITRSQDANLNCQRKLWHSVTVLISRTILFSIYCECIMYNCWQDVVSLNKVPLNIIPWILRQKNHPWFWCVRTFGGPMSYWDWLGRNHRPEVAHTWCITFVGALVVAVVINHRPVCDSRSGHIG